MCSITVCFFGLDLKLNMPRDAKNYEVVEHLPDIWKVIENLN